MLYGSVCSGIEAASVAWEPLGWQPAWFAEIDPFCNAVLAHHYPAVPNLGDFTQIGAHDGPIDLLVGGCPCQSFSVAGRRAGLADPRGNLTLAYLALTDRLRPRWLVYENVPGLLSDDHGRTFGTILGILGNLGYGFAYRVLDAQYFGVPQRRRRIFLVGYRGDWRPPAAVLFNRHSLSGYPAPCRETGQDVTPRLRGGAEGGRSHGTLNGSDQMSMVAACLNSSQQRLDATVETLIMIKGASIGRKPTAGPQWGEISFTEQSYTLNTTEVHAIAFAQNQRGEVTCNDTANSLKVGGGKPGQGYPAIAFTERTRQQGRTVETLNECAYALCNPGSGGRAQSRQIMAQMQVRRLTPKECERLQGLPDDWTRIPYRGKPAERCSDTPRYRAIGNSMAVPVMRWIGERIKTVEHLKEREDDAT